MQRFTSVIWWLFVIVMVLALVLLSGAARADIVDATHYTVSRDMLGQTGAGLAANGNTDGVVDNWDYSVWADHFGETGGTGAVADLAPGDSPGAKYVGVPEPAALVLAVGAVAALAVCRLNSSLPWERGNHHAQISSVVRDSAVR